MADRKQKHRMMRWMVGVFVVFSLATSWGAAAAIQVGPAGVPFYSWYVDPFYDGFFGIYSSKEAACKGFAENFCPPSDFVRQPDMPTDAVLQNGTRVIPGGAVICSCLGIKDGHYAGQMRKMTYSIGYSCPQDAVPSWGYNWQTGMCERHVEDTFTITLSGGTEVEPSKGSDLKTLPIIATVIDENTKQPTTNAVQVHISLKVEDPKSGGHDHGDSTRPRGGIADKKVCASDSECWKNPTVNGAVKFNFRAPEASGKYTITAICDGCSNTATKPVNVKVNGLEPIPAFPYYALEESDPDNPGQTKVIGATDLHSKNHYLTHAAAQRLMMIATQYHSHPTFRVLDRKTKTKVPPLPLHVNDASLEWGGKFDNKGTWTGSHAEHRRGTSVDLRANENVGAIPPELFEEFEKLIKKHIPGGDTKGKGKFLRECTPNEQPTESNPNPIQHNRMPINYCVSQVDGSFDTNRHYHVRLLGE